MKRVLIFDLQYYPFVGGAEVAIKEITDRIPREEIEFHLITARFDSTLPKMEQVGNVLVHRIGIGTRHPQIGDLKRFPLHLNKHLYQLWAVYIAGLLHLRYRFDGIWAMMAHSSGIPAGLFKTLHPEVSYLLTLQEGDPPEHIEHVMRPVMPLFRRGFEKADELQAISSFLQDWGKRMGFRGEGVVIPNAVDTKHFAQEFSEDQLRGMQDKLCKKEGDVFLVTTSRLVHKNAVDDVIRALPFLPGQVKFIVFGIGPDDAKLRSLARELGVDERVRFMGQIGHADMPLMLRACDIFIRPSRSEGMGNSFVEAMAAGLPVIATQEGGIADFLFDAKRNPEKETTGWAVDKDSPRQIAERVTEILGSPEHTRAVVNTARNLAFKNYDWDDVAARMRHLLLGMVSTGRNKHKVCIATPLYPPEIGGPATYAQILNEELPKQGIDAVTVPFRSVRKYPSGVRHLVYFATLLRRARRADLILALDPVSVGLPAYFAAVLLGKPFAVKIVGDFAWEQGRQRYGVTSTLDEFVREKRHSFPVWLMRLVQTSVAKRADLIIVPSQYLKGVVSMWGVPPERISVIYNAVEVSSEEAVQSDATDRPPVILTAGRLVPWKGISGVIQAVAAIRASRQDVQLIIAGDGPERAALEEEARESLGTGFRFLGAIEHRELLKLMRKCSVFVLNSTYEGLSHVLIEAQLAGIPTVATRAGGNSEVIEDGVNGLLVAPGDKQELTHACLRLLDDSSLRKQLLEGMCVSRTRFTKERMITETVDKIAPFL